MTESALEKDLAGSVRTEKRDDGGIRSDAEAREHL